ncbi:phage polarity suppression protein [Enterobacter wuhouensis]|uniref:phage polarity suppression protein n=1 Tax=Enterobacter wuhouensis TaxID=2529381 RepID=UPI0035249063
MKIIYSAKVRDILTIIRYRPDTASRDANREKLTPGRGPDLRPPKYRAGRTVARNNPPNIPFFFEISHVSLRCMAFLANF